MPRVDLIDPNESDNAELREFAPRVTRADGSVGQHFQAEANFPAVLTNTYDTRVAITRDPDIGPELFTKLAVAISLANDCQYCTGAYSTLLSGRLGGHEAVREFQERLARGELAGKEADVIDVALALLEDPAAVTDADFEHLREAYGFTDRSVVALVYAVNTVSGYNRLTVGLDLTYDHDYPKEWADPDSLPGGD